MNIRENAYIPLSVWLNNLLRVEKIIGIQIHIFPIHLRSLHCLIHLRYLLLLTVRTHCVRVIFLWKSTTRRWDSIFLNHKPLLQVSISGISLPVANLPSLLNFLRHICVHIFISCFFQHVFLIHHFSFMNIIVKNNSYWTI